MLVTSWPGRRRSPSAEFVRLVLAASGRRRRTLALPLTGLRAALRAEEALAGTTSPMTWDDAQMLAVEMLSGSGTRDAVALGVTPRRVRDVLRR